MKRVGILSDTHGFLHPRIRTFFKDLDEIWHAGDIGGVETAEALERLAITRAVYGNIDGRDIRSLFPEYQLFAAERARVLMIHTGGAPDRYSRQARELIRQHNPDLFVCGHSHILKVQYDKARNLLFINPGAAGNSGLHHSITAVRMKIDGERFLDLEVLDIPR